mmetsp:Transcript_45349/g.145928  ORF Transcript_45349/g.145928 Transcript_45349/m.145928 type:complete len:287 (+) Transcript_45349:1900-2760(+)
MRGVQGDAHEQEGGHEQPGVARPVALAAAAVGEHALVRRALVAELAGARGAADLAVAHGRVASDAVGVLALRVAHQRREGLGRARPVIWQQPRARLEAGQVVESRHLLGGVLEVGHVARPVAVEAPRARDARVLRRGVRPAEAVAAGAAHGRLCAGAEGPGVFRRASLAALGALLVLVLAARALFGRDGAFWAGVPNPAAGRARGQVRAEGAAGAPRAVVAGRAVGADAHGRGVVCRPRDGLAVLALLRGGLGERARLAELARRRRLVVALPFARVAEAAAARHAA